MVFALVSKSKPDEVLSRGESGGGKAKSGVVFVLFCKSSYVLVSLIVLYCILLLERLKVFYLLI